MGIDLGTIYASVGLKTTSLKAGAAEAKGIMSGLDKSMNLPSGAKAEKGLAGLASQLRNVASAGGPASGAISSIGGSLGALGTLSTVAIGAAALAGGLYVLATSAEKLQAIQAQTNSVIKSTGGIANVTADHVHSLAVKIADYSGVSHDALMQAENLGLAFTNVRNRAGEGNDVFDRMIVSAADLSVRLGQDVTSSVKVLGKALQDPLKGMTMLRRAGVVLTSSEMDQIKALAKNNDLLGEQKALLDALTVRYGGAAKAAGQTFSGQLKILKDELKQVEESAGKMTLGPLTKILKDITGPIKLVSSLKLPDWTGPLTKIGGTILKWINPLTSVKSLWQGLEGLFGGGKKAPEITPKVNLSELDRAKEAYKSGWGNAPDLRIKVDKTELDNAKSQYGQPEIWVWAPTVDMSAVTAAQTAAHQGWDLPDPTMMPTVDMSQVTASQTRAHQGWELPNPTMTPTVDMSGVTAAKISAHQGWDATGHVTLFTQTVVNPTFDHPHDAGVYIGEQISAGASGAEPITMNIGGPLEEMANASAIAGGAFGAFKNEMDAAPFKKVEEALMGVTGGSFAQLAVWRQLRGAYDDATKSLAEYDTQIKTEEANLKGLQKQQAQLNKELSDEQAQLQKLSQMKLTGETAATDKAFAQQEQLNTLKLQIMQAEDAHNYELAAQLQLQSDALDRTKQEADLQSQITFDPQKKAIEDMLDPLHGQEMAEQDILNAIWGTNQAIDAKTAALQTVNDQIDLEQTSIDELRDKYDVIKDAADSYKATIDELAKDFTDRWAEMLASVNKVNNAVGSGVTGGGVPGYASGGPVLSTGLALVHKGEYVLTPEMQAINFTGGGQTIVTVPLYLDGKIVATSVARIQGSSANARARSGGRY